VVLGASAERVAAEARAPEDVRVVVNRPLRDGMLTSVWAGLDEAERLGAGAVLIHPVDNPLVEPETVGAVLGALADGARIAVPSHAGRRGHPAGLRQAAPGRHLRGAPREGGARSVLAAHPEWVVHVPAGARLPVDLDTPEALEAARRALSEPGSREG
jgi:CTP:molybdopterin cytidylyltransferase MocA